MQLVRKLALGVATVSVAFGAGHLVQSGSDHGPKGAVTKAHLTSGTTNAGTGATDAGEAKPLATQLASQPGPAFADPTVGTVDKTLVKSARAPEPAVIIFDADAAQPETGEAGEVVLSSACAPTLTVTPRDGAMLDVLLFAPCAKDARVILRHGGLALSAHTTKTGALSLMLPALDSAGQVSVTLKDGTLVEAVAPVEMAGLRRFAVQWLSDDAIQLQIYEDGAAFGAPGNVSAARPQGAGSLAVLGDASADLPLMSEIYTFPQTAIPVQVTLEAEVTAANCGRDVLGQTLESVDGTVKTSDITLTMPGCEAVGDILVLNNLVGDTTLAQAE